uniref:Transglutaminase domain-containing protein n=1 Tax=viral metagenome TaxID=1070528 RepID=A0A6H1ZZK7_9ZZZZ
MLVTSIGFAGDDLRKPTLRKPNEKIEKIEKIMSTITAIKKASFMHQAKRPEQTLRDRSGNCVDKAVLVKYLAEKENLKATYKFSPKHVTCIVEENGEKFKYDNGKFERTF